MAQQSAQLPHKEKVVGANPTGAPIFALVMELADLATSKAAAERRPGASPGEGTNYSPLDANPARATREKIGQFPVD